MTVLKGRLLNGKPWLVSVAVAGVGTTTLGVSAVDSNRVFQRDTTTGNPSGFSTTYNKGWGAVPVTLTAAGALASVVLKVRLRAAASPGTYASPGTLIQDWTTVSGVSSLAAGANAIILTLPAGPVFYVVDVALGTDLANGVTVTGNLGVGSITAAAGQSIATGFFSLYAYSTPPSIAAMVSIAPGGVIYAPFILGNAPGAQGADTWQLPSDAPPSPYVTAFGAEYLRLVTSQLGVVAALVGDAYVGSAIVQWDAGGNIFSHYTALKNVLAHCGYKFDSFIWAQGGTDASYYMRRKTYAFRLGAILDALAAQVASTNPGWTYFTTLTPIPGWLSHDDRARTYAAIELACLDLAGSRPRVAFNPFMDAGYYFSGHETMLSRIRLARQHHRIFMGQLGTANGGFASRLGPSLTGAASRAAGSKVIKLTVAQNGGTALHAWTHTEAGATSTSETVSSDTTADIKNAAILFSVFPAGSTAVEQQVALDATTPFTINSATEVWLTLAALPADSAGFDVWFMADTVGGFCNNFTTPGMPALRDDVTDGDGIAYGREMQTLRVPVVVAPPTPATAVAAVLTAVPGQASPGLGGIAMAAAGSGFSSQPLLSFSGGGGSGAAACTEFDNLGYPQHALITNPGSGYTSAPTVSVSGGGGSGASGVALLMVPPAAGALTRVWGTAAGGTPPTGIEVSIDGGAFAAPGSLVIRSDGSWNGTITAPAAGTGHTIAARRAGGSAGASTTFTTVSIAGVYPAALQANLVAVFDTAQLGTMWQDTGKTTAPADLAPVRYMADALGHASNDVLNSSGNALAVPFLELDCQNGLPALAFDAVSTGTTGRILKSATGAAVAALQGGDCTILTVYRTILIGTGSSGVWSIARASQSYTDMSSMAVGDNGGQVQFYRYAQGTATQVSAGGSGNGISVGLRTVARFNASTGVLKFAVNGVTEKTATMSGALGSDWDTLSIGAALQNNGSTAYSVGKLHEVAFFNRLATDAERDALLAGATAKWGS